MILRLYHCRECDLVFGVDQEVEQTFIGCPDCKEEDTINDLHGFEGKVSSASL